MTEQPEHRIYRIVDWILRRAVLPVSLSIEKCALLWDCRLQATSGVTSLRSGAKSKSIVLVTRGY